MNPLQTSFFGPLALFFLAGAAAGLALVAASNITPEGVVAEHRRYGIGLVGSILFGCSLTLYFATAASDLVASGWLLATLVAFAAIVVAIVSFLLYTYVPTVLAH